MSIIQEIRDLKKAKLEGYVRCLPCQLDRFKDYYPGLVKGEPTCITGNTSSWKTGLTKKLFVYDSIEYAIKTGLELKILYFGFEESKRQAKWHMLSYLAYRKFGMRYNNREFDAMNHGVLDEDLTKLEQSNIDQELNLWKSYINWYDTPMTAYGVYKTVRDFAASRGTFYHKGKEINYELLGAEDVSWDTYKPNNPREFVIVIFDHASKVKTKKGQTKHEAMQELSDYLQQQIAYKFDYAPVIVQQQSNEGQNLDHVKAGHWMPQLSTMGKNAEIAQDYRVIIGIGNPKRYKIKNYHSYEIDKFKGFIRFANILKQTYGPVDIEVPLYVDGKTGYTESLPKPDNIAELTKIYQKIDTINGF